MGKSNKKDNPHAKHRYRMKEKFRRNGLKAFEPHEMVELLLYYARPRVDTNEIAHDLYNKFGSVAKILDADPNELQSVSGVGTETVTFIKFFREMFKEYTTQKNSPGTLLNTTEKIGEYLKCKYIGEKEEVVYLLCFDNTMKMLSCSEMSRGSAMGTEISVRKIIEIAIRENAGSVILSHNHPLGYPSPSSDDIASTVELRRRLKLVGVDMLDHIIVGNNMYVSLAQSGAFMFSD